ncbi:FecR domain-containing protein [uncultured Draconibacterium sp.]|uniref:FecR family protein n=1 Tax=uncultured Draconibacterium sp. TaxID=1573823 RepID=UPI002AA8D0B2|nr:FecR domain-containing protein [uncultured Draconibacterium sp.]
MKHKIDIKTVVDFAKGIYSYNDYLDIKSAFTSIKDDDELRTYLYSEWNQLVDESNRDSSLNHIFEKIQYNIMLDEKEAANRFSWWKVYRRIAAILLIPVLAFSLWSYFSQQSDHHKSSIEFAQSWVEINAPHGSRVEFLLPDGSHGWLNGGSKLKYPPVFGKQRKVELLGEAWFDVEHIEQSRFIVSLAEMNVKVLGTKFNISAYDEDISTSVILEEGKVEVEGKVGVFNEILEPNQKIEFNRLQRSLSVNSVDAKRFSAWKEGYLVIDNETLGEVENRIERWYNVKINLLDEELRNYKYKATFKDEPLEEVLRLLSKTIPIRYKIDREERSINETVNKRIVTIELRD